MTRVDEILPALEKELPLIERRVARLFVLASLMGLSPVEYLVASVHFAAYASFTGDVSPERGALLYRSVAEALHTLVEKKIDLDPVALCARMIAEGLAAHRAPGGVMLGEVDSAVPTVAFKPAASGWDDPIIDKG